MNHDYPKIRSIVITNFLALMVLFGSLGTASVTESFQSEESNLETTELVELALDEEVRIADHRIRVRRISYRDFSQFQSETLFQAQAAKVETGNRTRLPRPLRHNGCGSHLLV